MNGPSHHVTLAAMALLLGGLAALAGTPYEPIRGPVDSVLLLEEIAREQDHVTAVELAGWIRDRHPGLRVVDVRTASEFEEFHIPTAEHVPFPAVANLTIGAGETLVLYSAGGAHAAQAWVLLRSAGRGKVYFLSGGLDEWVDDVLNPTIETNATAAERAEFERMAELSRYFGGSPRVGVAPKLKRQAGTNAASHRGPAGRRRGC